MRVARPMVLSSDQQEILESRARARSAPARSVERVRIVLLAGAGLQDQQIAAKLKITPEKAARWRNRFLDGGLAALDKDAPAHIEDLILNIFAKFQLLRRGYVPGA